MNILVIVIPLAVIIGLLFVAGFVWAAKKGQFDDLVSPAHRILLDDLKENKKESKKGNKK
ncbi:MAG: cbb3-type cytochrome oxidase assembly protein CcoS [Bdellovibrionales bacterium]|nr:cbb3-type cytochrome oxidase assembly protein CcoS [Bdellovibrionales bacterium]